MSLLFLSKTSDWCKAAQRFIQAHARNVTILEGERGDQLPQDAQSWVGDYIISFLCPWLIPSSLLQRARVAAINFHPGPPDYPGIGCYNFALYQQALEYGVTCHHMAPKVDSGAIIKVLRFQIFPTDTVPLLKERSMVFLLTLYYEIISMIIAEKDLPASEEVWTRKPYTRKELDALCQITPGMSAEEIQSRVRATLHPGFPGPYLEIGGYKFIFTEMQDTGAGA